MDDRVGDDIIQAHASMNQTVHVITQSIDRIIEFNNQFSTNLAVSSADIENLERVMSLIREETAHDTHLRSLMRNEEQIEENLQDELERVGS